MWRKLAGYLLIFSSVGIVAIAIAMVLDPQTGIGTILGSLILALVFFFQGISYVCNDQQVSVVGPLAVGHEVSDDGEDFDPGKRKELIEKLKRLKGPKIVTVSEFFDGNMSDQGAIGPNLWPDHPGIPVFESCLVSLLHRDDVEAVYVHIKEVEPNDESWPYADRVYVFGDISDATLKNLVHALQPTEIGDRTDIFSPINRSIRSLGTKPIHVLWWD